jgi:hypothetical protein
VDIIHTLTNSQKGVTLKALAEVTAAKFAITHDAADQKAAALALADYLSHVDNQTRADAGTPKPKDT